MGMIRRRISAVLVAAVLAVRLLAPDVGHACESSLVGAETITSIEADAHAHHRGAPAHSASNTSSAAHVHDAPAVDADSDQSHECDCDTECCCVATAVSATREVPRLAAAYGNEPRAGFGRHSGWESAWVHHVLPFPTAPPSATLS